MMDFFALRGNVVQLLEQQAFRVQTLDRRGAQQNDLILRPKRFCEFDDLAGWPSDEKGTFATARLYEKQKGQPVEVQYQFDGHPMGLATADCTLFIFFHADSRTLSFRRVTELQATLAAGQYVTHSRGVYRIALIP